VENAVLFANVNFRKCKPEFLVQWKAPSISNKKAIFLIIMTKNGEIYVRVFKYCKNSQTLWDNPFIRGCWFSKSMLGTRSSKINKVYANARAHKWHKFKENYPIQRVHNTFGGMRYLVFFVAIFEMQAKNRGGKRESQLRASAGFCVFRGWGVRSARGMQRDMGFQLLRDCINWLAQTFARMSGFK